MAKITCSLGFTFRIGDLDTNQFAKVFHEVSEIDTDLPIESQLKKVDDARKIVWKYLMKRVDEQIDQILEEANG